MRDSNQPDELKLITPDTSTAGRLKKLLQVIAAPLILLIASIGFVSANANHAQMSLWDEYVYIDYLSKVPEQGIVRQGEMTGELAREYYSCIGVGVFGKIAPDNCQTNSFEADSDYPFGGKTSADAYTPLYFAVTWVVAQPFMWITGGDLVDGGRLAGSFWLAGAAIFFFYGLRRFRLSKTIAYAASLLLIASPAAWAANTFVSTDAPAMLAGASLMYFGLRFVQSGKGSAFLIAISVLSVAFKLQNFMAVVATALFLLLMYVTRNRSQETLPGVQDRSGKKKLLWTVVSMLVLPIIFQALWTVTARAIAVGPGSDAGDPSEFGITSLIKESFRFYGSVNFGIIVPADAVVGWTLAKLSTWLITAGIIAIIAIEPRFSYRYSYALASLATLFLAGPALALAIKLMQGYYFELPPRYGLSMFPIALAMAAALFDKKVETRFALLAIGGVTFVASLTPYFPGAVFG